MLTTAASEITLAPSMSIGLRRSLKRRIEKARQQAIRSGKEILITQTLSLPGETDPSTIALNLRKGGESCFLFEQPDRQRLAIATLGCIRTLNSHGNDRFRSAAIQWRQVITDSILDPQIGRFGYGPIAVGGFAFNPTNPSGQWSDFPAGMMVIPEIAIQRRGEEIYLTLYTQVTEDCEVHSVIDRIDYNLKRLTGSFPMLPDQDVNGGAGQTGLVGKDTKAHYIDAISKAVARINQAEFEKIVLARQLVIESESDFDVLSVFGAMRSKFSSCYCTCIYVEDTAFIAASPELLVRREGLRASTVALAGSIKRSTDPVEDDGLAKRLLESAKDREEQAIVARRIVEALKPYSVWVTAPEEPSVAKMSNIQHLATPIRAQLVEPISLLELIGHLHPTPAVGAEPRSAMRQIKDLEEIERGWYAGPIGWIDANEDGEFCVALRCALVQAERVHLYAGVGVVKDSNPESEFSETEDKFAAMLPLFAV